MSTTSGPQFLIVGSSCRDLDRFQNKFKTKVKGEINTLLYVYLVRPKIHIYTNDIESDHGSNL